jgi:hypothetical protein
VWNCGRVARFHQDRHRPHESRPQIHTLSLGHDTGPKHLCCGSTGSPTRPGAWRIMTRGVAAVAYHRHCGYAELCAVRRDISHKPFRDNPRNFSDKIDYATLLRNASPRTAGGLRPPGASPAVLGYIIHFIESCGAGLQALALRGGYMDNPHACGHKLARSKGCPHTHRACC